MIIVVLFITGKQTGIAQESIRWGIRVHSDSACSIIKKLLNNNKQKKIKITCHNQAIALKQMVPL